MSIGKVDMQYLRPSFTQPVSSGLMTNEDYEIAVGLRCADCRQTFTAEHICLCPSPSHSPTRTE